MRSSSVPEGYNLIEDAAFGAMRQIAVMYNRGDISREVASRNKERIYGEYNKEAKEFEYIYKLYSDYIKRTVMETEGNRTELRKLLNKCEEKGKVETEDYIGIASLGMRIVESVFPGEFTGRNSDGFPKGGF